MSGRTLRNGIIPLMALATLLLIPADPGFAADDKALFQPETPPAEEIIDRLKEGHPRLLVGPDDFRKLRQHIRTDVLLQTWYEHIRLDAEAMLDAEPSRYEIPDGKRLLATSRRVLGRIYTLALMYRLTDEQRYLDRAWAELEAATGFQDWNPSHFLDTAEMTHAFAIAYDWLYDEWTETQREMLREAMIMHGLTPAQRCYRGEAPYRWWVNAHNNWNQVCNGGIAMGALALADEEPELAGEILHAGLKSLPRAMRDFAPDGAWPEGPGYWHYATRYNVAHLAAMESALGTDFGFSQFPGFSSTADFPIYITGPVARTFNFADGSDRPIRAPQLSWLARKFDRPLYAWYQQKMADPHPLDLIWYDGPAAQPSAAEVPLDKHFRGAEVVTARSRWNDRNALFVGFKAGDNKANHSNLDLGSFVLDALGQRWVVDLGGDNYNLPAYFGKLRWTYYRLRAEGHNTFVLNPGEGPDQDPKAKAEVVRFESLPGRMTAVADLTPAYAAHAKLARRSIELTENRTQVIIDDEVETIAPAEFWWFLHTRAMIGILDGGRTAVLRAGGRRLRAEIVQPAEARFTEMDAAPLPGSPNPLGQHANEGVRKLAIHLSGVEELRLRVLLTPVQER